MKFTNAELWLILYALEKERQELYRTIENADDSYKNEIGEWGMCHKERDILLCAKLVDIIMKMQNHLSTTREEQAPPLP